MTAAPGRTRVVASHMLVMCSSCRSHGQPDGVPLAVGRYVHRVDHVADEEQSPAPRALLAVGLLDEIGLLLVAMAGAGDGIGAALVADRDDDLVAVLSYLDLDRDLRPVAVAVLARVHGGLGHRGLQPLEPGRFQPHVRHAVRDPRQREAFVAWLAGQRERVESAWHGPGYLSHDAPPTSPCCPRSPWCHADGDRCNDTSVMSSSCS